MVITLNAKLLDATTILENILEKNYSIPNPGKCPGNSGLIARWPHIIGSGWTLKTF